MKDFRVILGVCGSIAAPKAIELTSQLVQRGCQVQVVLTPAALEFVTPLPFKTLSREPVLTDLFDEAAGWKPTHIQVAEEADLLLVAPATAQTLAKMALGLADNVLTCLALALNPKARVLIAPALNCRMWEHPATQAHVTTLQGRGAEFLGPDSGRLACGTEGPGRLWPVEKIVERALEMLSQSP